MSQSIFIQTHVEACLLQEDKVVSTPLGDYSGLPWLAKPGDRPMDIHFENAYLGEEVLSPPFQNENMILGKGVHLHWMVPAFLGKEYGGKLNAAPNRWLVEKNNVEKWLVVSDYLHEAEIKSDSGGTLQIHLTDDYSVYPVTRLATDTSKPPFCYLGKHFPIEGVPSDAVLMKESFQERFGQPLTVLGFGHVQFSSCYPNCKSVFGFHDPEGKLGDTYNIAGWHATEEDDLLLKTVKAEKAGADADLSDFLKEKFGILLEKTTTAVPNAVDLSKTLYVAAIQMDGIPGNVLPNDLKMVVGNTASEAFSALVADEKNPNFPLIKVEDEDQLEYFLMNAQMDGHLVDQVPKFIEARHRKGFSLNKGGALNIFKEHFMGKTEEFKGFPLGDDLYKALNSLNKNKQDLNESENELDSLKAQLYTDWYKYMRAAYPPPGAKDLFPDRDNLEHLLRVSSLKELETTEKEHFRMLEEERRLSLIVAKIFQGKIKDLFKRLDNEVEITNTTTHSVLLNNSLIFPDFPADKNPAFAKTLTPKEMDYRLRILKGVKAKLQADLLPVDEYLENQKVKDALQLMEDKKKADGLAQNPATLPQNLTPDFPANPLLAETPEQPFWEPNEPVIAVDGFKFGSRSAETLCEIGAVEWSATNMLLTVANPFVMLKSSELDWCPFFMEWAVGLEDTPVNSTGLSPEAWKTAFFDNFYLDYDSPGVYRKPNNEAEPNDNDASFQGGVILNPFMRSAFVEGMDKYMAFCDIRLKSASDDEKKVWEEKKSLAQIAREKIREKDLLCQRLSGFNAACLMLRQVPQLEMKEPLGFESSVAFSKTVAALCKGNDQLSPSALYDFLPIRNGKLVIKQLRFLDNFGRFHDVENFDSVISADTLTSVELRNPDIIEYDVKMLTKEIFLPPRLVQPARLNFHFLEDGNKRMTDNPNTSPVCGWFVPNFLDENLMVFAANGQALGTLEKVIGWRDLPWEVPHSDDPTKNIEGKVTDTSFRTVIQKILENDRASSKTLQNEAAPNTFIDAFLSALQDGLANIAPADFALQSAKVLLIGQPIAVVRVRAGLQIKGYPALDQSWRATLLDVQNTSEFSEGEDASFLKREARFSGNWNLIDLPLRLGEHLQLNDGLLGYWLETEGSLSNKFFAPQANKDASEYITSYSDGFTDTGRKDNNANSFIHKINPDGEELSFTVLMDPRGVLHATTGVLPTEVISIPSELYQKALARMMMWFETGPVLQYERPLEPVAEGESLPPPRMYLDLPNISEYEWKWFEIGMPEGETISGKLLEIAKPEFSELHGTLPEIKNGYLVLSSIKPEKTTA
ncbi:MAG: hypothetical protein EAY75_09350 [Bacteroidetes bacterium]|nr:MAG: hypothetical protein EAY75_09350 [Bacteroidota bacterium]